MTVTIEVTNQNTLNMLREMEILGLIQMRSSVPEETAPPSSPEKKDFRWLRGIHEGIPGASVDEFLARCREDKEYELALEKRREEERKRYANKKLSS